MINKYKPLQLRDFDFCSNCESLEQQLQQKEEELNKAVEILTQSLNRNRDSGLYFNDVDVFIKSLKTTKEPHEPEQKRL